MNGDARVSGGRRFDYPRGVSAGIVPSTAGTSILDLLDSYREIVGEEAVERALASLPEDLRRRVAGLTRLSWLPVAELGVVIDAVGHAAGRDPDELLDQAARLATDRSFKKIWRVMLRLTSDEALIARTPSMYLVSRNVGKLQARVVEPGRAELTLSGWPDVSDRHLRTLGVTIVRVVELAGRRDPAIQVRRTADGALYTLTWTP
jgi:hypothetical protein